MKIWIHLNGLQQGPYDLSQLSQLPIDANTPVWYDGLPKWTAAGVAPATAPLFSTAQNQQQQTPPAPPTYVYINQPAPGMMPQPKPPTYIGWSILLTILCCSPIALAAIITGAISSARYNAADYNGARSMSNVTEWLLIIAFVFSPVVLLWLL
ncbi:MAG: CD225/dispanin family protein [Muribaculaceae bacterium]|nr:CD225/dispanin family protein [Muribaculaceae bacterium]